MAASVHRYWRRFFFQGRVIGTGGWLSVLALHAHHTSDPFPWDRQFPHWQTADEGCHSLRMGLREEDGGRDHKKGGISLRGLWCVFLLHAHRPYAATWHIPIQRFFNA